MYVVDTGLPWTKAPLLYAEEGPIASRNEVERIIAQGFSEVFHDPERLPPAACGRGRNSTLARHLGPPDAV